MYYTNRKKTKYFYKATVPCFMYDTSRKQDQVFL